MRRAGAAEDGKEEPMLHDSFFIRNTRIRNRICVPPMVCYHWTDESGVVSDRHVAHYRALARGGAGLIIQEATCVTKEGRLADSQLGIWEDGQIDGLRRIVQAVHAEGCPIFVQIHHAGVVGIAPQALCPDDYTLRRGGVEKRGVKMQEEDIARIQQAFVDAARRACEAGYDGVELHGCHSYLMCQFLNSRVNRRTDRYGAQPERFITEIMDGIRAVVPADFVVGIRLGAFEPTLADGIRHAQALEAHGIDFLDISYGFTDEDEAEKPADFPYKDVIYAAGEIKKQVSVPMFAVNGIRVAEDARGVLARTGVDMVNVGRSSLVNPAWAADALAGRETGRCLDCAVCQWRIDADRCAGRLLLRRTRQG